jgi:hypothetical protein
MTKISSGNTRFYKKVFPAMWLGILTVFLIVAVGTGAPEESATFLLIPLAMGVFGFFFFKNMLWDLVDEVYDCGDSLLIRNRGQEESIPLSNIMNVNALTQMNPPRVTLRLVVPSNFGAEITFSPAKRFSLNPFAKNEIAEELIVRVDRARARR